MKSFFTTMTPKKFLFLAAVLGALLFLSIVYGG